MSIKYIKHCISKFIAILIGRLLPYTYNDYFPFESIENLIIKHRLEDDSKKVAIFQIEWLLQSHTVNFVTSLISTGLNVDLFLYRNSLDLVDMSQIHNSNKVKIYDLSNFSESESIINRYSNLLRGEYLYFIGVEKKGLIMAGKLSDRHKVPLVYLNLELYMEDHIYYQPDNWIGLLRKDEIYYHQKAVATIVQDKFRAERLFKGNNINQCEQQLLFFPVSIPGTRNLKRQNYFHKKYCLDKSTKILLYFGIIRRDRFCIELAKISQNLPENVVMIIHGYYNSPEDKQEIEKYKNPHLFISTDMVEQKNITNIISSSDIGLTFYRNDCINERLTAFSSEKIALFMQSGVPIISFNNETYSELYQNFKCGEAIESLELINFASSIILQNYDEYRENAYNAFDKYYSFDSNFNLIKYFFIDSRNH